MLLYRSIRCSIVSNLPVYCLNVPGVPLCRTRLCCIVTVTLLCRTRQPHIVTRIELYRTPMLMYRTRYSSGIDRNLYAVVS